MRRYKTRNFGDNYKEQEEYFASDEYKQSFDNEVEEVEAVSHSGTDPESAHAHTPLWPRQQSFLHTSRGLCDSHAA